MLNETQQKNSGRSWTEIVYRGVSIANLPPEARKKFERIHRLIGDEGIELMATKQPPVAPFVLNIAVLVGNYLGDSSDAIVGQILLWLVQNDMQKQVRWAAVE